MWGTLNSQNTSKIPTVPSSRPRFRLQNQTLNTKQPMIVLRRARRGGSACTIVPLKKYDLLVLSGDGPRHNQAAALAVPVARGNSLPVVEKAGSGEARQKTLIRCMPPQTARGGFKRPNAISLPRVWNKKWVGVFGSRLRFFPKP